MEAWVGSIFVVPFNWAPAGWSTCGGQLLPVNQNQALYSLIGNIYGGTQPTTFGLPDLRGRTMVGASISGNGNPVVPYTIGQTGGAATATITQVPLHTHVVNQTLSLSGLSASGQANLPVTASFSNQNLTVTGSIQASTEAGAQDVPFAGATLGDLNPGTNNKIYRAPSTDPTKQVKLAPITSTGSLSATSTGSATGTVTLPVTGTMSGTVTVQPSGGSVVVETVGPFLALNPIICLNGYYPSKP